MTLPLAHGNAFLERGFYATKQIITGRESMNLKTIKGQKTIKDIVDKEGWTEKVSIDYSAINAVKISHVAYHKDLEKKKENKKKLEAQEKEDASDKRKRDKFEQEEKSWKVKVRDLENEITNCEEMLKTQEKVQEDSMKRAVSEKNANFMKANLEIANVAK